MAFLHLVSSAACAVSTLDGSVDDAEHIGAERWDLQQIDSVTEAAFLK
jgi:hypothetical protein